MYGCITHTPDSHLVGGGANAGLLPAQGWQGIALIAVVFIWFAFVNIFRCLLVFAPIALIAEFVCGFLGGGRENHC